MSVAGDGVSAQGVDDVATLHYLREATQSQERLSEGRSFSHQLLYVCMAVIAAVEDHKPATKAAYARVALFSPTVSALKDL